MKYVKVDEKITDIKRLIIKYSKSTYRQWLLSLSDDVILVGDNDTGKILTAIRWVLKYGNCKNMPKKIKKVIRMGVTTPTTTAICVKVANLRKHGYESLEDWIADPKNLYVGRRGRVWITKGEDKKIFHYPQSKWHNPFKVTKEMSVEKSLQKYKTHLHDSGLINQIDELRGLNLGCFCSQDGPCHAQILVDLVSAK